MHSRTNHTVWIRMINPSGVVLDGLVDLDDLGAFNASGF
jgi:hypothetical protein